MNNSGNLHTKAKHSPADSAHCIAPVTVPAVRRLRDDRLLVPGDHKSVDIVLSHTAAAASLDRAHHTHWGHTEREPPTADQVSVHKPVHSADADREPSLHL